MLKKTLVSLSLIAASSCLSAEIKNEKFQLLAENLETKDSNVVVAKGSVVVFSPTYYLSANKIIYNKKKESFELFDNVLVIKDNNIKTQSDYAFIDIKEKSSTQSPLFLQEQKSGIWLNSKSSKKKQDTISLEDSIVSSCDCANPDWSIRVSSASYDTKDEWLHTFNPRLYIGSVPILYSPYFGFPTNTKRRTGLLLPTLGYSNTDGLYYSQSVFYAPAQNYDFEFIPQIRNKRGYGVYTYFRYADSPYSLLKIQTGGFKEKKYYQEREKLKNQKHYGWNVDYSRTKLFSKKENHQDGLYASINYMNDVEYKTLENDKDISIDKNVESKINYFYNTPKYYGGVYAKYYIDTSRNSNDNVLQELPQIHLHKYYDSIFTSNIMYSLDSKFYNYTRRKGLKANIYEVSAPISYSRYFFDDYLYFNAKNEIILSRYNYDNKNGTQTFDSGSLIQNEIALEVASDLTRPYKDYIHTINLKAKYSKPKNIKKTGDLYNLTNNNEELKAFPILQKDENIKLSLNQSLYDTNSSKQIIKHKLTQEILYEDNKPKLQNLENYLKYKHKYGSVANKTVYNVQDKKFIENDSNLNISYKNFSLDAGYYKSKQTMHSEKEDLESYNFKTSYKFYDDYKLSYYENYNLKEKVRNKQGIGLNINDACWNLDLKFEKELIPSTTKDSSSIKQKIVYLQLELKPIGGLKQKYRINKKQ